MTAFSNRSLISNEAVKTITMKITKQISTREIEKESESIGEIKRHRQKDIALFLQQLLLALALLLSSSFAVSFNLIECYCEWARILITHLKMVDWFECVRVLALVSVC